MWKHRVVGVIPIGGDQADLVAVDEPVELARVKASKLENVTYDYIRAQKKAQAPEQAKEQEQEQKIKKGMGMR